MEQRKKPHRIHPGWWTLVLIVFVIGAIATSAVSFTGALRRFVPVTLVSDRSGLVMESGAKVKMLGVVVGQVSGIEGG
ncbi:MAG TPA: MCE-family protein MCE3A, partial [Mycobacterium sp.]|nr:MCE-family protein MCE3A [Mycobacterium sp.]